MRWPGSVKYGYLQLAVPDLAARLARALARRDWDAFCLNDAYSTQDQLAAQDTILRPFLDSYFPISEPLREAGLSCGSRSSSTTSTEWAVPTVRSSTWRPSSPKRHHVEIVSILRRLDKPMLDIPDRVPVIGLVDLRSGAADTRNPLLSETSELVPVEEEFYRYYNRLTDERITTYLRRTPYDVVVGTRSALNLAVARLGRPGSVRIAQEHMTQALIPASVHEQMRQLVPAARRGHDGHRGRCRRSPCGPGRRGPAGAGHPEQCSGSRGGPRHGDSKIVIAAGRLDEIKRYDLLVRASAKVITERPDWTFRIYGSGDQLRPLGTLIADLGLHNHVFRMGSYTPLDAEWVKGSIAAVTSDKESFGMTIVEAMRCGAAGGQHQLPGRPGRDHPGR